MVDEIRKHIGDTKTAPFLFIGSGFSRRYLNLEDWSSLLFKYANVNNVDYQYYYSTAEKYLPKVASLIAEDLHEKWWKDTQFEKSRKRYKEFCLGKDSALKIEIAHYIKGAFKNLTSEKSLIDEIDLCKNLVIDGIITTNWDNLLENIFKDFKTYIGQNELIFSTPQGVGEIYKIHGCCSQPNSLVLTENDYCTFEKRNPYLAAKLLTIFTEHPIIFLGYSLTDENILKILDSISSCLTSENIKKLQDRLIFIDWDPSLKNIELGTHTINRDTFRIPVKIIKLSSYESLFKALSRVERKFPARLLRLLKEHVYDLVLTNKSTNKLYVQDIESVSDVKDLDVVLGVGAISKVVGAGYKRYDRNDLITDLLSDNDRFDADKIVNDTLPEILKCTKYTPYFKFLTASKYFNNGSLAINEIDLRVLKHFKDAVKVEYYYPSSNTYLKKKDEVYALELPFVSIVSDKGFDYFLKHFPFVNQKYWDSESLKQILRENQEILKGNDATLKNLFYKMVCFYDFIRYYLKQ